MTKIPTDPFERVLYYRKLGHKGGSVKSEAKRRAVALNARKPYVTPPRKKPKPKPLVDVDTSCKKCGAQPPYDLKMNGPFGKRWFWKGEYRCGECGHRNIVWNRPGTDRKRRTGSVI